ncbi:MAG: hypothetical protein HYW89_02765 [Candidatus Sungiibacteriota bacterium]|uniref:Uncharacterized protein n=1 Tax=Candidatus Sungiibacteriota bacterium TaxID=2750080 RepID=A0A7T5RIU8_9BACT|nr:MAG: hypothetical protein HYW89_02765 [Candidatus Sungbacteria bacterium]
MSRTELPNSIRKFLRREKARIRRGVFDSEEAEKRISELVAKTFMVYSKKRLKNKPSK